MGSKSSKPPPSSESTVNTYQGSTEERGGFHIFELHSPSMGAGMLAFLVVVAVVLALCFMCKRCTRYVQGAAGAAGAAAANLNPLIGMAWQGAWPGQAVPRGRNGRRGGQVPPMRHRSRAQCVAGRVAEGGAYRGSADQSELAELGLRGPLGGVRALQEPDDDDEVEPV